MLELTYNHDGRTYDLGTAYGHIAIGVDDSGLSHDSRLGREDNEHPAVDGGLRLSGWVERH